MGSGWKGHFSPVNHSNTIQSRASVSVCMRKRADSCFLGVFTRRRLRSTCLHVSHVKHVSSSLSGSCRVIGESELVGLRIPSNEQYTRKEEICRVSGKRQEPMSSYIINHVVVYLLFTTCTCSHSGSGRFLSRCIFFVFGSTRLLNVSDWSTA